MSRFQNKKSNVRHITIEAEQAGRRIDNFLLAELKKLPKSRIYQMLRRGEVRIDGHRIKQGYRLSAGDIIRIPPVIIEQSSTSLPISGYLLEKVKNSVIFENEDIIGLDKPAGIVVHSGTGRSYGVIELLRKLMPAEPGLQLVHRLDRETSGCLLIARNLSALRRLQESFRVGRVKKHYIALLMGRLEDDSVIVEQPLKKNIVRSGERLVSPDARGKIALTRFYMEKKIEQSSLVRIEIETGRTHQIRVHAVSLGHPIAGDNKYGDTDFNKAMKKSGLKRMFLHASSLEIPADAKSAEIKINAPLPKELSGFLIDYEQQQ